MKLISRDLKFWTSSQRHINGPTGAFPFFRQCDPYDLSEPNSRHPPLPPSNITLPATLYRTCLKLLKGLMSGFCNHSKKWYLLKEYLVISLKSDRGKKGKKVIHLLHNHHFPNSLIPSSSSSFARTNYKWTSDGWILL